jgi:hypothetical protein
VFCFVGTLIIFRVDFNNSAVKETSKRLHNIPNLPDITSDTFFKVFPFCILIDPSMRINHTGKSIKSLFPVDTVLAGRHLDEIFRLIRPDIVLEWNKVILLFQLFFFFINLFVFSYLVMVDILYF